MARVSRQSCFGRERRFDALQRSGFPSVALTPCGVVVCGCAPPSFQLLTQSKPSTSFERFGEFDAPVASKSATCRNRCCSLGLNPFARQFPMLASPPMAAGERDERVQALEREVQALRAQVAELQRAAARYEETEGTFLAEREELLREAERAAHLGTWTWDIRGGQVTWSEELHRILGIEPGAVTPSVERFFSMAHPEDRPRAQASAEQGIKDGVLPPIDCRIVRLDGAIRHTTSTGSYLFDAEGNARRMVGAVLDRTPHLEVEAKLRRALEFLEEAQRVAQLGSWRFYPDNGEVEWSSEFRRIAGLPPDIAPSIELLLNQIVEEDRIQFRSRYAQEMANPAGGEIDGRIRRPNGEIRHVRFKGILIPGVGGVRSELRGMMQDITDQVRMREDLVQSQKMEAVGRLAGGIAHDFNNLLMVVLGNLILMEPQINDTEALKDCFRALDSASNLTRRLLAFGRKAQLTLKLVDANELVNSTLSLMKRLVGGQVRLETDLGEGVAMVQVDTLEFERALVNLVVNARDVMPGGGTVTIVTRDAQEGGNHYVEISVTDDGPGIPEADRPHIFEPFYTTRPGTGGTGLGLATVLGTAEQHGGTVRVSAREGGGSVFTIRLPAAWDAPVSQKEPVKATPLSHPPRALTFLVIDDEPSVAVVIRRLLTSREHTVHVAIFPEQATAIWAEHKDSIDLVICDVMMPEMRGPELIAHLAESGVTPRVLFMSGYNDESAAAVREHRVLPKPFTDLTLEAAIDVALAEALT